MIDKLLKNMEVTADESFSVDFNVHEKLTFHNNCSLSFMDIENEQSRYEPEICATVEGNITEIKEKLERQYDQMLHENNDQYTSGTDCDRFLVTLSKLIELKGSICCEVVEGKVCGKPLEFCSNIESCVLLLRWSCPDKHFGEWESAELLCKRGSNNIYTLNILQACSILFSGNNYAKVNLLSDMLGLKFISKTYYNQIQRRYCAPVIHDFWVDMRKRTSDILKNYMELCLCGDGRNDSPGHSAK